VTTDLSKAL